MIINAIHGGAGLNLSVKAYPSADELPASAREGAIAVITDIALTNYVFSDLAPTNGSAGTVWINTAGGSVSYPVDKDGILTLYPAKCSVYDGSGWVLCDAYLRKYGQWLPFSTAASDVPGIEKTLEASIGINNTYRHCNALYTSDFVRVGSLGSSLQGINYVGEGTDDYNAMMVPVPAFSFSGASKELKLALYLWTSNKSNRTFRWAVTTSRENEDLYKSYGDVTEPNQLGAGSFTPPYGGAYQWFTIELTGCTVASDTPLYIYLWRDNSTYGNIHVMSSVVVTLVYEE